MRARDLNTTGWRTTKEVPMLFTRWLALAAGAMAAGCGGATSTDLLSSDASTQADSPLDSGAPDVSQAQDVGQPPEAAPPKDVVVVDTTPPVDTGPPPDTGPVYPPVFCGGTTCPVPGGDCCVDNPNVGGFGDSGAVTYSCQTPADPTGCASDGNSPVECDEGADCPSGQQCCGTLRNDDSGYEIVRCSATCDPTGMTQRLFCNPKSSTDESACEAIGETCGESTLLPGYNVCKM
jgi:hypothetical protein